MLIFVNVNFFCSSKCSITCVCTSSAMTGRKMMMVAVLLANSVKQAMKAVMKMTATGGGTCARGCKWLPIHTANPDSYSQSKTYGLLIHQFQEA